MVVKTFSALITGGQLRHQVSLGDLEGQQVQVTVVAEAAAPTDTEPPEEIDVERDVYVRMPFRGEHVIGARIVEGGRLRPCLIVPR